MKNSEIKHALNLAFDEIFLRKLDKRTIITKQILSVFSEDELKQIEAKRISRFDANRSDKFTNSVDKLKGMKLFAKSAGSYAKILIEGRTNIYLCSEVYKHSDYNKTSYFKNTPANRQKMKIINKWLGKN